MGNCVAGHPANNNKQKQKQQNTFIQPIHHQQQQHTDVLTNQGKITNEANLKQIIVSVNDTQNNKSKQNLNGSLIVQEDSMEVNSDTKPPATSGQIKPIKSQTHSNFKSYKPLDLVALQNEYNKLTARRISIHLG